MAIYGHITGRQMKRLQTLWGLFCRQANLDGKDREARLGWVAGAIGRQIGSFRELTMEEAKTAIEAVQKHLPAELLKRNRPATAGRPPRQLANAYGTAGRKSAHKSPAGTGAGSEVRMADAGTLQLLSNLLTALGWTRERLDSFLRSSKSPVRSGRIHTLAEANRVIWVLKRFIAREKKARDGEDVLRRERSPAVPRGSHQSSMATAAPNSRSAPFAEISAR